MAFSLAEVGDLAYKLFVCGGSSPPLYNDVSFVRSTESTYKALTHSADMCTFNESNIIRCLTKLHNSLDSFLLYFHLFNLTELV